MLIWILQVDESRLHCYLLGYQIGLEHIYVQSCNFVSLFTCLKQRLSLDICCMPSENDQPDILKLIEAVSSSSSADVFHVR